MNEEQLSKEKYNQHSTYCSRRAQLVENVQGLDRDWRGRGPVSKKDINYVTDRTPRVRRRRRKASEVKEIINSPRTNDAPLLLSSLDRYNERLDEEITSPVRNESRLSPGKVWKTGLGSDAIIHRFRIRYDYSSE
ncbi:hypothetical protein EVAR_84123_1 [Eumeta japonica]|uniref:Uncharacterized protein n=1 Tax=Eumeta variegata TaxID=151549 RepID=A0A4C1V089_EUMVA|nr:hypothetical protein EVAR_84123_1 [Eumeta japonica]